MKGIAGLLMRQEIARAVAAERARCAKVCREVMARRGGARGDGAEECLVAIERGPVLP